MDVSSRVKVREKTGRVPRECRTRAEMFCGLAVVRALGEPIQGRCSHWAREKELGGTDEIADLRLVLIIRGGFRFEEEGVVRCISRLALKTRKR